MHDHDYGEGHDEHGHHKEKHGHHKELWQAFKDESMPADERVQKLGEFKGIFTKKIEKIDTLISKLKK